MGKDSLRVFLDIRSGSVGLAIVRFASNGILKDVPEVIFCIRKHLPFIQKSKNERLLSTTINVVREVLITGRKHVQKDFKEVHVTFGPPWYFYETQTIKHASEKETICDKNWFKKIADSEVEAFISRNFHNRKPDIIEKTLLRATLNGYETSSPLTGAAKEYEFTFYISAVELSTTNSIRGSISEILGISEVKMHTMAPLCLSAVLFIFEGVVKQYMVVDLGNEITEFFLVRDELIVTSFSIPYGQHSVIKEISKDLRVSPTVAQSIYKSYLDGVLISTHKYMVENSLKRARGLWADLTVTALRDISAQYILSSVIILVGMKENSNFYKSVLEGKELGDIFPKQNPLDIRILVAEDLKLKSGTTVTGGKLDLFLAMEISSIDKSDRFK